MSDQQVETSQRDISQGHYRDIRQYGQGRITESVSAFQDEDRNSH